MARSESIDDARIAAALSHLPPFTRWRGDRVPPPMRRRLGEIDDEQLLMSAVVELLGRLGRGDVERGDGTRAAGARRVTPGPGLRRGP